MRRPGPRPLAEALKAVASEASPGTLIAAVQEAWPAAAGETLAAAARPTSEHDGTVTIACESAVWAQELDLLGPELRERLNAALDAPRVANLRFVVGSSPNRS